MDDYFKENWNYSRKWIIKNAPNKVKSCVSILLEELCKEPISRYFENINTKNQTTKHKQKEKK